MAHHALLVLPDDGVAPLVRALAGARCSIRLKMFVLTDARLIHALVAARARGVEVRVLLNAARRDGARDNDAARALLTAGDVAVREGHPAFAVTHEKSLVVDDACGWVQSFNWDPGEFAGTRDFAVRTVDPAELAEMVACFEADWRREAFAVGEGHRLIWCRGNGRERVTAFIDAARHALWVQNERYQDPLVLEHLVRARMRGVHVRVMARPPRALKPDQRREGIAGLRIMQDVGIRVRRLRRLRLHAKAMVADGRRAIVGSINLAPGSFDARRELAIESHAAGVVRRLARILRHDWRHARALDLRDATIAELLHEAEAPGA